MNGSDKQIWADGYRVLKPGGYALIFSSIRLMHRLMVDLEETGFRIRDVLMWVFLNGMSKSRDVGLDIDKEVGAESKKAGKYNYVRGYDKFFLVSKVRQHAEDYNYSIAERRLKNVLG